MNDHYELKKKESSANGAAEAVELLESQFSTSMDRSKRIAQDILERICSSKQ